MDLADELARVAHELHEPRSVEGTIGAIVSAAASVVPGAEMAAVAQHRGGAVIPTVQTDELVSVIDKLQTDLVEGPCLATLVGADEIVVADLATDERYVRFGPEAARRGVRSALSLRLQVAGRTLGSLSLFARPPGALASEDSRTAAALFASHAAVALSGAGREANLSVALESRDVIGQAKGILMERHGLDAEEAFATLARLSQTRHVKLAEIAASVAASPRRRDDPPSPHGRTPATSV